MNIKVQTERVSVSGVFAGTWMRVQYGSEVHNFKAGYVMRSATAYAFSDAVIAGFDNEGNARLLRPYLYATSVGTTGATGLTGFETIDRVNPASLVKFWTKVDAGRTV